MSHATPFARPLYIMSKPVGSLCNLACDYCYYLEKRDLYPAQSKHVMSDDLLELFIKNYIAAQTTPQVMFTWHGGEPLMRPLSFYQRVVALQHKYANGRVIENAIQTNGTLLTEDWCRFLRQEQWLVGISIDGPQVYHDRYRRTKANGPSFFKVMQGIRLLQKYDVAWNAMAVVNAYNVEDPEGFYDFFKQLGCKYLQFTPIVERLQPDKHLSSVAQSGDLAPFSITPEAWGRFLCSVFDAWVQTDVGDIFVQLFDATLANWVGEQPSLCTMAQTCGHAGVMEYNGDVYACDHYVFPDYRLGNIRHQSLIEMMYSDRQLAFGQDKQRLLTPQCQSCTYLFACNGECPKNRFAHDAQGNAGHNYLCAGYYTFFHHVAPYMDYMKAELLQGRPPANVMHANLMTIAPEEVE